MLKIALLITVLAFSLKSFSQNSYSTIKGEAEFTSDAPLELIKAKSTQLKGLLKTSDRSFAFKVAMNSFEGFNSSLQKSHFNENYVESEKYPFSIFEGKIIEDIDFQKPGTYQVRGKGKFTCHGVEQERIIKCKLTISKDKITVTSQFTVMLNDHNIKIPSVVSQKIAEEMLVNIIIELTPKK